ncbi:MAG: ATP-binding cassette domain-containing protein [Ilumatobacteraceae bacterium]
MSDLGDDEGPAVEVSGLWKVFGHRGEAAVEMSRAGASRADVLAETGCTIGVRDVGFEVARGETFVVMGLSGSGKSTLVRCLSRLIEPTSGSVRIQGADLLAMNDADLRQLRRTSMSMVFQHFGLFPHRRVVDNVAYGLEVQGVPKAQRREQARAVLDQVSPAQLQRCTSRSRLSGGMQQRVSLARALALDGDPVLRQRTVLRAGPVDPPRHGTNWCACS